MSPASFSFGYSAISSVLTVFRMQGLDIQTQYVNEWPINQDDSEYFSSVLRNVSLLRSRFQARHATLPSLLGRRALRDEPTNGAKETTERLSDPNFVLFCFVTILVFQALTC